MLVFSFIMIKLFEYSNVMQFWNLTTKLIENIHLIEKTQLFKIIFTFEPTNKMKN